MKNEQGVVELGNTVWWDKYEESRPNLYLSDKVYSEIASAIADIYRFHEVKLGHTIGLSTTIDTIPQCHPIFEKYTMTQTIAGTYRINFINSDTNTNTNINITKTLLSEYTFKELRNREIKL